MSIKIIQEDALTWLSKNRNVGTIVTGLPDMIEVKMKEQDYRDWFYNAILACILSVSKGCPAVFCQTDRKVNGGIISKANIMMNAATMCGFRLMWHKIVIRHGIGKIDLMRPGYSHFMAFGSKEKGCKPGRATPDIISFTEALYENGMDFKVANQAVLYAMKFSNKIVDPFCGMGTVPIIAHQLGCVATGIDLDPKQCDTARALGTYKQFPYKAVNKVQFGQTKPFFAGL